MASVIVISIILVTVLCILYYYVHIKSKHPVAHLSLVPDDNTEINVKVRQNVHSERIFNHLLN